jgi:hypothetical protein
VRELVIVLSGLPGHRFPSLAQITRFARAAPLRQDWREWVLSWLASLSGARWPPVSPAALAGWDVTGLPPGRTGWLATPVHLIAGLTRLHLDPAGPLWLSAEEQRQLAADFARTFAPQHTLVGLRSGEFLLLGAELEAHTFEPARCIGVELSDALPSGPGAAGLRRLGSEIGMWLHSHPLNRALESRGARTISALWLWGGGPLSAPPHRPTAADHTAVFGDDASSLGIAHICGIAGGLPQQLPELFGYPAVAHAVVVLEAGRMLTDTIDARFLAPAIAALRSGALRRLRVLASDRVLALQSRDLWKFWRRLPAARPELH